MRWRGRRQSTNIEDRRGQPPARGRSARGGRRVRLPAGAARMSPRMAILVVVVLIGAQLMGVDVLSLLQGGGSQTPPAGRAGQRP